jgi:drug/metabolite transporter (DMT)-like permease
MNPTYRAYLDLAAAMTIVGSSVVVGKIIVTDFPIFMALTIRFAIALPLLLFVSHRRVILALPSVRMLAQVFLQALTGVFLFNVLLLAGLRFTTAAQSGLLGSTTPALITIMGWLLLGERITRHEWLGVALSVGGIVVVNTIGVEGALTMSASTLLGNGLVLGAFVCEALFTVFRRTSQGIPPLLGATWVTGFGLLLCLPVGIVQIARFDLQSITAEQILVLLYYGVFVSALAYFLWFRGLENASTGAAGILSAMLPISAVGLSAIILGEALTLAHLLGLVLVLGAVAVMTLGSSTQMKSQGDLLT